MTRAAVLGLALLTVAVPAVEAGEASKTTYDYVHTPPPVRYDCTSVAPPDAGPEVLDPVPNVAVGGICRELPYNSTFRFTVHGDEGTPAPFQVNVDDGAYLVCQGHDAEGTLTIEIPPEGEEVCRNMDLYIEADAPLTGTLTIERLE